MTIKRIDGNRKKPFAQNEINLSGPLGSIYMLMGVVKEVCSFNRVPSQHILDGMGAGNYENALIVFDYFLGGAFTLYCDDDLFESVQRQKRLPMILLGKGDDDE